MSVQNQKDKKWLVRSQRNILGPYTQQEVEKHLREGHLNGNDEISVSFGRYHQLRQTPAFKDLVEELEKALEMTMSIAGDTKTLKLGNTVTDTDDILDVGHFDRTDPGFVVSEEKPKKTEGKPSGAAPRFGSSMDRQVENKVRSYQKRLWLGVAGAVFILLLVFAWKKGVLTSGGAGFSELLSQGWKAYQVGDYETSWSFFQKANNLKPGQAEVTVKLSILRMILKEERVAAYRDLESLLASQKARGQAAEIYTALGLFYMESREWSKAENYFSRAEGIDSSFRSNLLNQMMLSFYQKNWRSLQKKAKMVMETGDRSLLSYFISGWGYIKEYEESLKKGQRQVRFLTQADRALKIVTSKPNSYRGLAYLLRAYTSVLSQSGQEKEQVAAFIETLSESPSDYYRDILVYNSDVDWGDVFNECHFVAKKLTTPGWMRSLQTLCSLLVQREGEAESFIKEASFMAPKDDLVQTVRAFYQWRLGRDEEALFSSRQAQKPRRFSLPFLIEADLCLQKNNTKCAQKLWKSAVQIKPDNLSAYMQLVRKSGKSKKWKEKIKKWYPNYLPLYRLLQE